MIAAKMKMRPIIVTNNAGRTRPGLEAPHQPLRSKTPDRRIAHGCSVRESPGPHADLDLGRLIACGCRELVHRISQEASAGPSVQRSERAPVDRHRDPRSQERHRLCGAHGIEMACAEARTPAPDRNQGEVEVRRRRARARGRRPCRRRRTRGTSRAARSQRAQRGPSTRHAARRARRGSLARAHPRSRAHHRRAPRARRRSLAFARAPRGPGER